MSDPRMVSIIISSYSYGRFLTEAIDSALNQTYPHTEVIVVDDGSTDNSREIIAGYGTRIIPVLKGNGGQASAFNAGFRISRGEVICFLDSDDALFPTAVEKAIDLFLVADVVKVHWPLWTVDEHGRKKGDVVPHQVLSEGDLREVVMRGGPCSYVWPPTSGNAWARRLLERIFPVPEVEYRVCPDLYLSALAPIFGLMKRISEPQGFWRIHGGNHSWREPFDERLKLVLRRWDHCARTLSDYCRRMGVYVNPELWKADSWFHQIHQATQEIAALIPPGDAFVLVDDDSWVTDEVVGARRRIPFLERDGQYWGRPSDDITAIRELERLRRSGANFIVFGWTSFWWLDYYSDFHRHLRSEFRCVLRNDRLVVFDLRP